MNKTTWKQSANVQYVKWMPNVDKNAKKRLATVVMASRQNTKEL